MTKEAALGARVPSAGNRSLLRRINALGVLTQLRDGPKTVAQAATATGLSRTTTEAVVGDLSQAGWLRAESRGARGGTVIGRPALRYGLATDAGHVASVDIGAHHLSAVVATLAGAVVERAWVKVDGDLPADARITQALDLLASTLEAAGISAADVWVLAVGSPGVITRGTVTHFGGIGLPGWIGLDIGAAFRARYDCPVIVEGDCALGALAERWVGAAQHANQLVYILSGVRTGAAVISGGRLHRGAHGGTGLIGELPELRWRDLERETYGASDFASGQRPERSVIFERARAGDPAARRAVDDFADALGLGVSAMVLAVDPELVVIGGPTARDGDVFLDRMREVLARRCPLPPAVETSVLGGEAVSLGGVRLALDRIGASLTAAVDRSDSFPAATPEAARFPVA